MARAAAMAMAKAAKQRGLDETAILPRTDDIEVAAAIAAATAMAAQEEGVAGLSISRDRLRDMALAYSCRTRGDLRAGGERPRPLLRRGRGGRPALSGINALRR